MLVLNLQFWQGDKVQAMALARLLADVEEKPRSDVTFLFTARYDCGHDMETVDYVRKKFVNTVVYTTRRKGEGWPKGPNQMFADSYAYCIDQIRGGKIKAEAILFIEADCVPLHRKWLDMLIQEYKECGKMILGCWVVDKRGKAHINGNCIIHKDFWRRARSILNPSNVAWDAAFAPFMLPQAAASKLIFSDYHLGVDGYNEWKGCNFLFEPRKIGPGHPLSGQSVTPVWLHGPKDMRGINCVRQRLFGLSPEPFKEADCPECTAPAVEPVTDIFVVTYAPDAHWLEYLLRSIQKYCRGFRQTIVMYPTKDRILFEKICSKFPFVKGIGFHEAPDGHMHHNIIKCTADTYSDAEYFLHIDSDCVFLELTKPSDFMTAGKPDLIFTSYETLNTGAQKVPWQEVTRRAIGMQCDFETMRRHPFLYPRELYKATRDRVELVNKMNFERYVFTAPKVGGAHRGFSEFNALGSVGLYLLPEKFNLCDTKDGVKPMKVRQYWSYSGMTPQERFELEWVTQDYDKDHSARDEWAVYVKTQGSG